MFTGLLHAHSILRYLLLLLLLVAIIKSFSGWFGKKPFTPGDRKISLFTMIAAHLQLVIGIALYFISPTVKIGLANMGAAMKDVLLRFFTIEHSLMMLIAIVLITLGSMRAKRAATDEAKHKQVALFFLIALVIIFIAIPWPWREHLGRGWHVEHVISHFE